MRTLIFNGSPRINGDTKSLINELIKNLDGEYKIVEAYHCNISPCVDCRYCYKHAGCCKNDDWQEIDKYIRDCDNILIASPNYFSELSGQLLAVASRLQSYWSARHFRKEELIPKKKRGGIVLVGGGDGHMSTPITTATCLLNHMNAHNIAAPVCFHDTNNNPAIEDADTIAHLKELAAFFNDNVNIND